MTANLTSQLPSILQRDSHSIWLHNRTWRSCSFKSWYLESLDHLVDWLGCIAMNICLERSSSRILNTLIKMLNLVTWMVGSGRENSPNWSNTKLKIKVSKTLDLSQLQITTLTTTYYELSFLSYSVSLWENNCSDFLFIFLGSKQIAVSFDNDVLTFSALFVLFICFILKKKIERLWKYTLTENVLASYLDLDCAVRFGPRTCWLPW